MTVLTSANSNLNSTILGLLLLDVYLYKSIMILFNINVTAHMATCSFVSHVGPHWHILSHGITWYQGSLPLSASHRLSLRSCYCYTCCDATNVEYIYRTLNGVSISFALIVGKFFSIFEAQRKTFFLLIHRWNSWASNIICINWLERA